MTKSWLFEEIKKKDQQTPSQAHQEENQDPKIKVSIERGKNNNPYNRNTLKVLSEYYQLLNVNKLDNLEAKEKILEIYSLSRPRKG